MSQTKRLTRSSTDNKILGVCGGIGEYFNIDSTLVRIIFLVFFFSYGIGFIPYFIMALLVPYDYQVSGNRRKHQRDRQTFTRGGGNFTSRPRQDVTPEDEEDWSNF